MRNPEYTTNESLHLAWFALALILFFGIYEVWVSHQAAKAFQKFDQAIGQVQQ